MRDFQDFLRVILNPEVLSNPDAAGQILILFATLSIFACGFVLMFSAFHTALRLYSVRFFVLGIFFVVCSVVATAFLSPRTGMLMLPDWLIVWLGILGGSAFILGAKKAGTLFLLPAGVRFAVVPNIGPEWDALPPIARQIIIPVVLALFAIFVLKSIVKFIYGEGTASHVAGTYLIRLFDTLWRSFSSFFTAPFRWWLKGGSE